MKRFVFSLGSAGHAILDNLFAIYFLFFLLPPVESGLAERVGNDVLFWGLTLAGLIVLFGRLADAVFDPLVAQWSDRRRGKLGRRRFFLITGPLPFVVLTVLLFVPPLAGPGALNVLWELGMLGAFFVFYTWYLVPYLALIGEITATHEQRIALTTAQAASSLAGAVLVMLGLPLLWAWLDSFPVAVMVCATIALPLLWAPAAVIREEPAVVRVGEVAPESLRHAMAVIFRNRPFLIYLAAKVCLFTAFNIMRAIVAYYPVVLLGQPQSFQTLLLAAVFGSGALCFFLVKALSQRVSNKALMASALLAFALLLPWCLVIGGAGAWAVPLAVAQMLLLGWPVAVLLVVPNALVADLAEADSRQNGVRREGMFFGVQGLVVKTIYGLTAVFLGFLFAEFGKDAARPLGVELAGGLGGVLGLIGFGVMLRFPKR